MHRATSYLVQLPTRETEREKCVWFWHMVLVTLAWDVANVAIAAAFDLPSIRAARILNRSLLEYAARTHLYICSPDLAEAHVAQAENMLRRVVRPVAEWQPSDEALQAMRDLVARGDTRAQQPRGRDMFEALVANFIADPDQRPPYVDSLEGEYMLATSYVHGSQISFFDVVNGPTGQVHPRTRSLLRDAEALRCITCMLTLLAGLQIHYRTDFQVSGFVGISSLLRYDPATSIATHDTLRLLLGIA